MSHPATETILIVAGDEHLRTGLGDAFSRLGFAVHATRVGALTALDSEPDIVVVDTGGLAADLRIVRDLRALHPSARLVVMVPCPSARLVFTALRLGATHCIARTPDADRILGALTEAERPLLLPTIEESFPTLDEARSAHIGMALDLARGNVSRAARLLGIHRQSLQRILRQTRQAPAADESAA